MENYIIFKSVLMLAGLSPVNLSIGYDIFYYIHIGTILGFLLYIPGFRHLHLFAAAPNVFFKRLEVEKTELIHDFKVDLFDQSDMDIAENFDETTK